MFLDELGSIHSEKHEPRTDCGAMQGTMGLESSMGRNRKENHAQCGGGGGWAGREAPRRWSGDEW